jgi:hypothetical protein
MGQADGNQQQVMIQQQQPMQQQQVPMQLPQVNTAQLDAL